MALAAMLSTDPLPSPRSGALKRLPGEEGIWMFVLGDMVIFGLFFVVFLYYRGLNPELFVRSQARLDVNYGAVNTLLLLTSSWLVVSGVGAVRAGAARRARRLFGLALLCGLGFVAIKISEYVIKFHEGISLTTNEFYMYYFMYTGIHLLHVSLGLCLLLFMARRASHATPADAATFETGATFWHMVDLLWIMLFPLLYLVK